MTATIWTDDKPTRSHNSAVISAVSGRILWWSSALSGGLVTNAALIIAFLYLFSVFE